MALRRGFKTEAQQLAKSLRQELGVRVDEPFDPRSIAAHLEIPLIRLSEMKSSAPFAASWYSSKGQSEFSAVTVFNGSKRWIIYNDSHSPGRQSNDIAHEIAHGVLLHQPGPALDFFGCRNLNKDYEDEANWLGGVLLISDEAALRIVRSKMSMEVATNSYLVSRPLLEYRIRMSGARTRLARTANWYAQRTSS